MISISNIEVVFSFDTTGSIYPCFTQVRPKLKQTAAQLLDEIPGIRIGIIAAKTYITEILDLSVYIDEICNFVQYGYRF